METHDSTYRGHQRQKKYADAVRRLVDKIRQYPELGEECTCLERALDGIVQPFEVAIFGRMKTGKSSILNAFLGQILSVTGVDEKTATINRILYGSGNQLSSFFVCWKNQPPSLRPIEELQSDWNGTDSEIPRKIEDIDHLELYSDAERLKAVHIIDTPGTGSTATAHENIAQQFIGGQETDALIYVCSFEVRETDLRDLRTFREGGLTTPTPYNCVCLLHKWDLTYWNNGGNMELIQSKARWLEGQLDGLVSCVLPVNAPLSMVAKAAKIDFWKKVKAVLDGFSSEELLTRALSYDAKWNLAPERAALYKAAKNDFDMPWDSFRVMLRHLFRQSSIVPEGYAEALMGLSGYPELEKLLDRQFFNNAAIIKQRQIRARVRTAMKSIYEKIDGILATDRQDTEFLDEVQEETRNPRVRAWASSKSYSLKSRVEALEAAWNEWDALKIEISDKSDLVDKEYEIGKWLDADNSLFSSEQKRLICQLIRINSGDDEPIPSMQEMGELYRFVSQLCQSPEAEIKTAANNIRIFILSISEQIFKTQK